MLLDTHAFLWAIEDNPRLSPADREIFRESELLLSSASVWEVVTKYLIGRLSRPSPRANSCLRTSNGTRFPVNVRHVLRLETLPLHHKDPFDRLLIAQALEEDVAILTADPLISKYDVKVVWYRGLVPLTKRSQQRGEAAIAEARKRPGWSL